jgi:hypothetical protein
MEEQMEKTRRFQFQTESDFESVQRRANRPLCQGKKRNPWKKTAKISIRNRNRKPKGLHYSLYCLFERKIGIVNKILLKRPNNLPWAYAKGWAGNP